jgi:hypothetical protein
MKPFRMVSVPLFTLFTLAALTASAQVTVPLPGRSLAKLLPDYLRPRVYALNKATGSVPGTLLALNSTNGAILNEISVNLNPTDMAITPAGDSLYVINAGSRTISKVDLTTFTVVGEKSISTPNTYSTANPLYLVAGQSGTVYYTDGAWGPEIYAIDFNAGTNSLLLSTGGNQSIGAGGLALNRSGNTLYIWQQYGWSAGYANSSIVSMAVGTNSLTTITTGPSQSRDPLDTPIFLDAGEQRVFNKVQMVSATNVTVLLSQFSENIYAISLDGSLAFGPTKVFNAVNGIELTNLSFSSTVQTLSGDQAKLFRYNAPSTNLVIYDMSTIAPVSGPTLAPTPPNGAVVGLPPTNLIWTVSPIALGYDVYFGTDQAQVAVATPLSPQYLGRVTAPGWTLGQPLSLGATYYWRVDVAGFSVTNAGPVWSFTVSSLAVNPAQVSIGGIAGFNPALVSLSLTSSTPLAWSAGVAGANWLTLNASNGVSPSTLTLRFNTAGLTAGVYTNLVNITNGALVVQVPVTADIKPLNIVKMATDYQRPYIYAIQAPALSGQNGQLLFINTATEAIEKTLPIGFNPVDLTVHYGENRLYIASWTENATYVIDLGTQSLLPPLHLGTDVYKINAGRPGRIVTEGEDQWIAVNMVDTASGNVVGSMPYPEREGDGEMDPTGANYYHCDNNISNAHIHKEQLVNDVATEVAASNEHPYGSRNLVLSPDGTTLFWQGYIYDRNLNELGYLGEQIYATTAHGDLALGVQHVFNSHNGQSLYTWPFSTSILAVSGDQQKVVLFNSTTRQLTVIPMSSIATVPGPGLNPTPADDSVINPPLGQLSWTVSPFALSYRVFMGTDHDAVASATINSPLYLGSTSSNIFALSGGLTAGSTYYWRVDSVGFASVVTGAVWSFTVSAATVSPQSLSLSGVTGLPLLPQSISINATIPTAWTLSIAQPWMTASATSGTTPSSVTLNFNATNLAAGSYSNQITLTANGTTLPMPVVLQLFDLNATKIAVDPNRNYIYVLHPGSGNFADAFLLFLNTDTGVVETVIPIGINPTDLTMNRFEDRLYVSNWQHNQTRVVDLSTRTELAPLSLGTDVYKINAGQAGRVMTEGEDQWVYATLINTTDGSTIVSGFIREGDGEFDPSGRYYYHCDNNISGAGVTKFDMSSNTFAFVVGAPGHYYYGSRNLVRSLDGSRLFWTSAAYDANLTDLGVLGAEIYSCSTNGSVAFSDHQAFDSATRQVIFNLPVTSTVSAVDRLDQRLWYFNGVTHRMENLPLAVIRMPTITQQPATNTTVGIGGTVYLSATAMGLAPLSYKWMLGGTNLANSTNYFVSISGIQPAQAGNYQLIVSNPFGSVTSIVAQVTVLVPPSITAQPQGTSVYAGQPFSLSVAASGSSPLRCQWNFEGLNIAGATNFSLSVANAQAANEGLYTSVIANGAGAVTSFVALVRVLPAAPSIVAGPAPLKAPAASNVIFAVTARGSQPLSYQWWFNGTVLAGATASQYSISDVQSWHAGNYQVVVTNSLGAVTSAVASLTVTPVTPYFVSQPVGATLPAGTNITLSGLARGSEPIGYQWRHYTEDLANANQTYLTISNLQPADSGGYSLLAFSVAGVSTSQVANVVVTAAPPVFVQQPVASLAALAGSSATLTTMATGSAPLQYRWYFQNTLLLNQTNRQLTLNPVTLGSAGQYFATASNNFGVTTSTVAQVTVNQSPVVQQPLTDQVVDINSTITLAVNVQGSPSLAYSWQLNGQPISGSSATLSLTNIQPSQSGYYRVTVTNQYGSVSSTGRVSVLGWPSSVIAWGDNSGGQTNVPPNLTDAVAVAGGDYHSVALHHDGTLIAWGYNGDGQTSVSTNALRFVSLASGAAHGLAITEKGGAVAWGRNDAGQCNVPTGASNSVLAVVAGDAHSLALLSSGSVLAWGDNSLGQCSVPQGLSGVRSIAAGRNHSLALRASGAAVGWGFNAYGQASAPVLSNAMAIAAGYLHSVALLSNGTVVVWGDNTFGQANVPAGLTNAVAIAAGDFHTLALRADGTVVAWGDDSYRQLEVPGNLTNALAVASGNYHGLALVPALGVLQPSLMSSLFVVRWSGLGTLQWAPTALGPFTDVGCQGTSYTNLDMSAPARFFRLRR